MKGVNVYDRWQLQLSCGTAWTARAKGVLSNMSCRMKKYEHAAAQITINPGVLRTHAGHTFGPYVLTHGRAIPSRAATSKCITEWPVQYLLWQVRVERARILELTRYSAGHGRVHASVHLSTPACSTQSGCPAGTCGAKAFVPSRQHVLLMRHSCKFPLALFAHWA